MVAYGISINLVEVTWKSKIKAQFPNPNDYSAFMGDFSTATGALLRRALAARAAAVAAAAATVHALQMHRRCWRRRCHAAAPANRSVQCLLLLAPLCPLPWPVNLAPPAPPPPSPPLLQAP